MNSLSRVPVIKPPVVGPLKNPLPRFFWERERDYIVNSVQMRKQRGSWPDDGEHLDIHRNPSSKYFSAGWQSVSISRKEKERDCRVSRGLSLHVGLDFLSTETVENQIGAFIVINEPKLLHNLHSSAKPKVLSAGGRGVSPWQRII